MDQLGQNSFEIWDFLVKNGPAHFWTKKKKVFFDPDQKKNLIFWSGSRLFFDPVSKKVLSPDHFWAKIMDHFWSWLKKKNDPRFKKPMTPREKNDPKIKKWSRIILDHFSNFQLRIIFGPFFFESRIKKKWSNFWSGSKIMNLIFDPDHEIFGPGSWDHMILAQIAKDQMIHDLPTVHDVSL